MAKATVKMPEEFLLKISRLGDKTDVIVPKVLKAGADVVYDRVKGNLEAVVGKETKYESKSTGELVSALGISSVKQDKDGNSNLKIGFAEPRSDGGSNAKIANVLEYGKHGQPPKPFLAPAKTATKKACSEAMIAALESELDQV